MPSAIRSAIRSAVRSAVRNMAGAAALPPVTTNLHAHYSPSGPFWQDSARTIPAAAHGDPVGAWDDLTGRGRHLLQATAGRRPLLKAAAVNGIRAVLFDGVDDYMVAGWTAFAQPFTVVIVAKSLEPSEGKDFYSSAGGGCEFKRAGGGYWFMYAGGFYYDGLSNGNWNYHVHEWNTTASVVRVNSVPSIPGSVGTQQSDGLTLAAQGSAFSGNAAIEIAEVSVYTGLLSAADKLTLEKYLAQKYGLFAPAPPLPVTANLVARFDGAGPFWQDSARTTIASADGDTVGAWDEIGGGNHALQATAGDRPTLKLGILNGKSALRFDGISDFLQKTPGGFTIANPRTIFVVGSVGGSSAFARTIDSADSGGGRSLMGKHGDNATNAIYAGTVVTYPEAIPTPVRCWAIVFNGATSALYRNGTQVVTGDAGPAAMAGLRIAAGATAGAGAANEFAAVDVAEVLVYSGAMNATDRQTIESYLMTKYGL